MSTLVKGRITEAAILNAFTRRDLPVLVPFGEGQPYDLLVDLSGREFLRVQCKTARWRKGCLIFNGRATDHGRGRLPYLGLADVFGVFSPATNCVYIVPVADASTHMVYLRVDPPRNNQRRGIKIAAEYEIDRWSVNMLCEVVRAAPALASAP